MHLQYTNTLYSKTFYIPEMIFDPSLALSPHIFLLAILFKHRAFLAEDLNNNPDSLHRLRISPDSRELQLFLKPEMQDVYLFRKPIKEFTGWSLSRDPIPYLTMAQWVRRIGRLSGFESNTICYSLRYMAANNMDRNGTINVPLPCLSNLNET